MPGLPFCSATNFRICIGVSFLWLIVLLPVSAAHTSLDEIEVLRQRLIEDAMEKKGFVASTERYITSDFGKAGDYRAQLTEEGRWQDVDYTDTDNEWNLLVALDRMLVMTYAYRNPVDPRYESPELLAGIESAIDYWYQVNPRCKNWYKNDIAKQFYFNVMALLLQDAISEPRLTRLTEDLTAAPSMTGSNKTLVSISVFYRGVIEKNPARISAGITGVMDQVRVSLKEGIQPDNSFHQHGPFIYNGSYGIGFLRETVWLASIAAGTRFAYAEEEMAILRAYYLEGTRWMLRRGTLDYNVRGRQVGRTSGFGLGGRDIVPPLDRFLAADPTHDDLYRESQQRILQGIPQAIQGNRHFWRSDYTAHHRAGYFASLKMCSIRTIGMEMDVNSENLYGYYLPYGLTYLYRRGDEYLDIFPVWDWARLPGVTSPHEAFAMKGKSTQETTFVGGVSDSVYGVSAMELDVQQTQAQKAWFWFDREWVALGAGIQSAHEAPIVTGINQTLLTGPVIVDGRAFSKGMARLKKPSWVWHDSVAYVFPKTQAVTIKAEPQRGHVQKIFGLGADSVYQSDVFSLWFAHGQQPQDATYMYTVVPACGPEEVKTYARHSPILLLANTPRLQAVSHEQLGLTGLVFYVAGECTLPGGLQVAVDQPCLVLVNEPAQTISISDPTAELKEIGLTLRPQAGPARHRVVTLPVEAHAGSSVRVGW